MECQQAAGSQNSCMGVVLEAVPAPDMLLLDTVYLVYKTRPLRESKVPWYLQKLLQFVFDTWGYWYLSPDAPSNSYCSLEFIGVYTDKGEATWAALAPGYHVCPVTLNVSLPDETCQWKPQDMPGEPWETRIRYQNPKLDLVAIPRAHLMALREAAYLATNGNGHSQ